MGHGVTHAAKGGEQPNLQQRAISSGVQSSRIDYLWWVCIPLSVFISNMDICDGELQVADDSADERAKPWWVVLQPPKKTEQIPPEKKNSLEQQQINAL